jgi:hypothetical protein
VRFLLQVQFGTYSVVLGRVNPSCTGEEIGMCGLVVRSTKKEAVISDSEEKERVKDSKTARHFE